MTQQLCTAHLHGYNHMAEELLPLEEVVESLYDLQHHDESIKELIIKLKTFIWHHS